MRRVRAKHYLPRPGGGGPSWLAFIGHAKDSLWDSVLLVMLDPWLRILKRFTDHADKGGSGHQECRHHVLDVRSPCGDAVAT